MIHMFFLPLIYMFLNFFLHFVIFKLVFVTPLLGLFLSIFSCLLRAFYSHPPWRCWIYTANIHLQEMWCEICNWVKVFNCHTFWASHLTLRLHPPQEGTVYGLWVSWKGYQSQAVCGHCGTSLRDPLLWSFPCLSQNFSELHAVWGSFYPILLPSSLSQVPALNYGLKAFPCT